MSLRVRRGLLTLLMVLVAALWLSACELTPFTGAADAPKLAMVGDSLTPVELATTRLSADGWNASVNGYLGASTADGFDAISQLVKSDPQAIVIELGTNDVVQIVQGGKTWEAFRSDVRAALQLVPSVPCVVWVGLETSNGSWGPQIGQLANRIIVQELQASGRPASAALYGDWSSASSGHPEYFVAPGDVHLSPAGARAFTDLVSDTVGECAGAPIFGRIESVVGGRDAITATGWVIDPDTTAPIDLHVLVDGQDVLSVTADGYRPDVEVYERGAAHGFSITVPAAGGQHQLCLVAINVGPASPNPTLGCRPVMVPVLGSPGRFTSLGDPTRILDSRLGVGGFATRWSPGQTRDLAVVGVAGVPVDATAVVMNVTVTDPSASGYVSVFPSGQPLPNASNLNYSAGQTIANLVTVPVGVAGQVSLFSTSGTHVIVDVAGYYRVGDAGAGFTSTVDPTRILDSRLGIGGFARRWLAGQTRDLAVVGVAGVPVDATAVVMNVTVTDPSASGYVSVFADGRTPPATSNLNFSAGQTIANLVTVPVGETGTVSLFSTSSVQLIADAVGYYQHGSGQVFVPMTPNRAVDSRFGPQYSIPWEANETRDIQLGGAYGVPAEARAVVLNTTVTDTAGPGYLTVFPAGRDRTTTSTLNFMGGQTIANLTVARLGTGGRVSIYSAGSATHVVADIAGFFIDGP